MSLITSYTEEKQRYTVGLMTYTAKHTCMYVCIFKRIKCRTAYVLETYDIVMLLNRLLKMSLLPKNTMSCVL